MLSIIMTLFFQVIETSLRSLTCRHLDVYLGRKTFLSSFFHFMIPRPGSRWRSALGVFSSGLRTSSRHLAGKLCVEQSLSSSTLKVTNSSFGKAWGKPQS